MHGRGRLQELVFTKGYNCTDFAGIILLFWIGGRLREVVSHGGSTVFKNFFFLRDGFVEEGCANLWKESPWNYPLAIKTTTEKF